MAQQNAAFDLLCRRQMPQPGAMPVIDLLMCRPIGSTHRIRRLMNEPPVVIAADIHPALRHDRVRRRRSLKRARKMVTQIHHQIGRLPAQIGLHRFESSQIPVDVRDYRNAHGYE